MKHTFTWRAIFYNMWPCPKKGTLWLKKEFKKNGRELGRLAATKITDDAKFSYKVPLLGHGHIQYMYIDIFRINPW